MNQPLPNVIVQALAKRFGYEGLSPESQQHLAELFGPELAQNVTEDMLDTLAAETRAEAYAFIEKEDAEGLFTYLRDNVPDFRERLKSALPR